MDLDLLGLNGTEQLQNLVKERGRGSKKETDRGWERKREGEGREAR